MTTCLAIFEASGEILYKSNTKIGPFNKLVTRIVNETCSTIDTDFYGSIEVDKKLYCLKKERTYVAIYLDSVLAIDSDKVKQSLIDILKVYGKLNDEFEEARDVNTLERRNKLIEYRLENLVNHKIEAKQSQPKPTENVNNRDKKKSSMKKMRKWDGDETSDVTTKEELDFSDKRDTNGEQVIAMESKNGTTAFTKNSDNLVLINELNDILDDDVEESEPKEEKSRLLSFLSKLSTYIGTSADINDLTRKFKDHLISKNVAPQTATIILDRIKERFGSETVTMSSFKEALTEELTKVLSPNVSTDLLYEIVEHRSSQNKPYVISVVGVNGVGKSTNLAKLAYWLLQNNLSVLITACDTFRSGAVEQLKVHVNNLQKLQSSHNTSSRVALFEQGYGGGDHVVVTAKLALKYASNENYNVVLLDTAGRTHSNQKLMAPLRKFGDAANPDRIIMVGEALVGTDSVEQAINFNNAFGSRRGLDFFIISKVDTVGDIVGTMINMVMATKIPILFIGTGQTYTDIKRLNVRKIVDLLVN